MMPRCPMAHFPLAHSSPLSREPVDEAVRFIVTLGCNGAMITLSMEQEGRIGQGYIAIEQDTFVEVVLCGDQLFFSKEYDGVTWKGANLDHFYGGFEYGGYDKRLDRYRTIRFAARFNKGGKFGTKHPFNINVDLLQDGGEQPRWIGLTIDPDIVNPPPTDR